MVAYVENSARPETWARYTSRDGEMWSGLLKMRTQSVKLNRTLILTLTLILLTLLHRTIWWCMVSVGTR